MSDLSRTSFRGDDVGLGASDIDRALHTSLERGRRLVRRRQRRRAVASGLGVVLLLVGGFGVLQSLGDDTTVVVTPADGSGGERAGTSLSVPTTSTTTTSSVPAPAPDGYVRTELPDGVTWYQNSREPAPQTTTTFANGVGLGDPGGAARGAVIRSAAFVSPYVLHVEFECVRLSTDRVQSVLFRRVGSTVELRARVEAEPGGSPCDGGSGASIDLVFPAGDLPADATVVQGEFSDPEG